jgi:tetratricopeptide (TPR) repeat protein
MSRLKIAIVLVGCSLAACSAERSDAQRKQARMQGDCLVALADTDLSRAQQKAKVAEERERGAAWVAVGHALVRLARTESRPELYVHAVQCSERALQVQPNDPNAQHLAGVVLLNDHRFAEARALAQQLIARDADDVFAYGLLSDAALELGEVPVAVDAAQRMLDLKPSLLSYGRAAHLRWLTGDAQGATELYRLAIAAGLHLPDREPSAWMITEAARVFMHAGDLAGADAGFDAALREVPEYAPALQGKGRVALLRGDARAAAGLLERAQKKDGLVETTWLLGDAYAKLGDGARATAQYARVERDGEAHDPRMLALFYAERGERLERALSLARAELKARADAYSHDVLALALFRAGKHEEARAHMRQALALGTPDVRFSAHSELIIGAQASLRGAP